MLWFKELGTGLRVLVVVGGMVALPGLLWLIFSLISDFRGTIQSIKRHTVNLGKAIFHLFLWFGIQLRLLSAKSLLNIALSKHWFLAPCAVRHMREKDDLRKVVEQRHYETQVLASARFCTFYGHEWDGCKCTICGQRRNEQHKRVGCKCVHCGYSVPEWHVWEGCKCTRCGAVRNEEHDWSNGIFCARCNMVRPHKHQWVFHSEERICPDHCAVEIPPFVDEETRDAFCPGPEDCSRAITNTYKRCKICGEIRLEAYADEEQGCVE